MAIILHINYLILNLKLTHNVVYQIYLNKKFLVKIFVSRKGNYYNLES